MADDLSSSLLTLIDSSIPSFQAAEALLFFAANRDRDFSAEEVVAGMRRASSPSRRWSVRRTIHDTTARDRRRGPDTGPRLQNSNAASVSCRVNTTKDP